MTAAPGTNARGGWAPGREAALVTVAALLAAVLALVLTPLGSAVFYGLGGVAAAGLFLRGARAEVLPPLRAAVDRIRPRAVPGSRRSSRGASIAVALAAAGSAAAVTLVLGDRAPMALGGLAGLLLVAVAGWLCWPLIHDLLTRPPEDLPARPGRATPTAQPAPGRRALGRRAQVAGTVGVGVAIGPVALVLASSGVKILVAGAAAAVVVVLICVVRDRSVAFTFLAAASLAFMLHKSIGPQDLELSSGAISVYVTSFDAMLVLLYAFWIGEGTFAADVRAGFRRPILRLPLVGAFLLLPSLLVATQPWLGAGELVRMGWMYLLFFYAAVRIRTRRHVWAVLGGLAVFASFELIVVLGQALTGGTLGLAFLGVPTELTQRVAGAESLGRPFGTIIHPVFMGAVLGSLCLVALSLAVHLQRSLAKIAAGLMVVVCAAPLYLSHARASVLAVAVAAVYVVATGLARGRLRWSTLGRVALLGVAVGAAFLPQLAAKFSENFFTAHFWEEIDSRLQLNTIALDMWDDHLLLGVGLNNFEVVLPRYEEHFVIFFGNPVHNLYLLNLSETGVLGLLGLLLVGGAMFWAAVRGARSADRLLGGTSIGIVAVMVFLALEELLGFSLRQDVPLAVYWLLAGLAVACARLSDAAAPGTDAVGPRRTRRAPRPPRAPVTGPRSRTDASRPAGSARPGSLRPPLHVALVSAAFSRALARPVLAVCRALRRRRRLLAVLVAGVLAAGALPAATPVSAAEPVAGGIVFQAEVRATGESAIFSAASDGSAVRRLTPSDGRDYHWPRWAFGDRKIVYTSRPADSLEPATRLEIMNADGSGPRVISSFDFAVGQPRVDATGDWLFFTGAPPWFPDHAIFRMDLRTLESINLTGVTSPIGGLDADPALSPDGTSLYLVSGSVDHADVTQMSVDGRTRRPVTRDMYWNTDPDVSPDGRTLAISSYRGPETPSQGGLVARPNDFHLVLHDLASGTERVMTAGAACVTRTPAAPCSVPEMSAYAPRFTLDGRDVGFTGALDRTTTCICAIGVDGSNARAIISSTVLAISWFDFSRADGADGEGAIGSEQRSSRLLVTMASGEGVAPVLVDGSPDLMHRTELPLPEGLDPLQARWSPDRSRIAFTARATVPGVARSPHPAAPAGAVRREHVTLADLDPVTYATRSLDPPGSAEEQVFLREADGSVRALTDPWVEDWQDGVRSGDARANTDPVFTADGRAVIVTNTSTLTGESFLLRIDLATGSVLNLTNATSGALPVDDRTSALSPDGRRVAFAWTNGAFTDIYTMGTDGSDVREVTTTDAPDSQPTWLPDGSGIVSVSERSSGPALVRTRLGTGRETVLTPPGAPVSRPVAAPEGDRVLYLGQTVTNLSVFGVGLQGGAATFVLQPDPLHQHLDLDWR